MTWFLVWTALVVGTLVGAFLLGRDLLRRGKRLLGALEESDEVMARLDAKVAELEALRPEPEPWAPDPETARARRAELRERREARTRERRARHEATIETWRRLTH